MDQDDCLAAARAAANGKLSDYELQRLLDHVAFPAGAGMNRHLRGIFSRATLRSPQARG